MSGSSRASANASTVCLDGYRTCQNESWKTVSGQCSLFIAPCISHTLFINFYSSFLWIDFTNLFQEFFAQHVSNGQRNQKSAYRKYKILHALFDPSEYSDVRQIFYVIGAILLFPCTARKLLLLVIFLLFSTGFQSQSADSKRSDCHADPSPDVRHIAGLCIAALLGRGCIGYTAACKVEQLLSLA